MKRALGLLFFLATASCGGELPSVVRDEMARAPRGTVTVIVFSDFQCPFCRRTHAALAPIVRERRDKDGGRVRVVLKHVPLRSHPDARGAARAAICAEQIGGDAAGEAYAHALFTADDLGDEACEREAVARGIDRDAFRACVADPATNARIERDTEAFESLEGDGVPLVFVGRTRFDGQPSRAQLEAAIDSQSSQK